MVSDLHRLLGELRQFVDTVAGDNRPSQEWAIVLRSKIDAMPEAALSRTGAVKVDRQRLNMEISKWATDSDLHVTIGDVEALHKAILSTLEPAALEGQQPVAYRVHAPEDEYYGVGPDRLQFHPLSQHDLDTGYRQTPLYTRPSEQPVTEAMVEAAISIMFHKHGWFPPRQVVKDALKAAMEAGRHE